jgi:hypothetical protein
MTIPNRPLGLGFALITTLFASACDQGPEDHDAARLAVVLVTADGLEHGAGTYDVESGELTFAPAVQDEMREVIGGNGYRAVVTHDGEDADVDLDDGMAATTPDLEDGDVFELRAARADGGTSTIGRLELRAAASAGFRKKVETIWKEGNITGTDDWEASP